MNFNIATEGIGPKLEWNLMPFNYVPDCFSYISMRYFVYRNFMICVWISTSYRIAIFVRWYSIIRYAWYPFIPVSLSDTSLSWYLCITNHQYRLSHFCTFSAFFLVLPLPFATLLIFQMKHTSQPYRSVYENKGGRPFTTLLVLPTTFVCICNSLWCHRNLVAFILSKCTDVV